jgi:hypothetical protein
MKKVKYSPKLAEFVKRHTVADKLDSIFSLLGDEAQAVLNWAEEEASRRKREEKLRDSLGKIIYNLIGHEAAIRLVKMNNKRGRMTTKGEVKLRTGQKVEMPVLYREAGLRHPQEARNLRHNFFHEAFSALIDHLFPGVTTSVPVTGQGSLSPDLIVEHKNPDWSICVEYKGYRSITLLSESELLKGMRYQDAYGAAWLVTTTNKSSHLVYGPTLSSKKVIDEGLARLDRVAKRSVYTEEQRENRGIARKGMKHLEKQRGINLQCQLISAEELLASCSRGKPKKGIAITTGMEFIKHLRDAGLHKHADNVMHVMKLPTHKLHSDTVTSVRLIE